MRLRVRTKLHAAISILRSHELDSRQTLEEFGRAHLECHTPRYHSDHILGHLPVREKAACTHFMWIERLLGQRTNLVSARVILIIPDGK